MNDGYDFNHSVVLDSKVCLSFNGYGDSPTKCHNFGQMIGVCVILVCGKETLKGKGMVLSIEGHSPSFLFDVEFSYIVTMGVFHGKPVNSFAKRPSE